MQDHIAVN